MARAILQIQLNKQVSQTPIKLFTIPFLRLLAFYVSVADMISEEVLKIFTCCASYFGEQFNADMVDGGTHEVCVRCDEDYMVAMAYVADCHTYKREVNLENTDWERERSKMVDLFMRLLNFQ